jgi:outer membrane protein assembly factor BamB
MPSRRRFLAALGVTSAGGVAGCLGGGGYDDAADAAGDRTDWPTAGHDARNTNYVPEGTPIRTGTGEAWRVNVPTVTAQPVVTGDTVVASVGTDVLALDAATGDKRWSLDPDNDAASYWASPTVHDGVVYVTESTQSVVALDLASGDRLWTYGANPGSYVSPVVGYEGRGVFVGGQGHVTRINRETGRLEWTRDLFGNVRETLATRSPLVYAVTEGGVLYALSEGDGEGYWRVDLPAKSSTPPTVVSGTVYVGCFDGRLYAVDTDRASVDWSTDIGGFAKGGIAVADGTVYADGGRRIHAVDAEDGTTRWSHPVGSAADHTPVVVDDTVYSTGDRLYAFKPEGGLTDGRIRADATRFTTPFAGGYAGPMSAADGRLYLGVNDGSGDGLSTTHLVALEAR